MLHFYWLWHHKLLQIFGYGETFEEVAEYSMFIPVLGRLWASWEMPDDLMDELEAFRHALYGNPRTTSVNELHYM